MPGVCPGGGGDAEVSTWSVHKYVLGPTQTHFSPSRLARVKMSSEKGPKYIYAQENKLWYYYYHFEGHWENKHWKKWQQNGLKNISFTNDVRKRQQTL